MSKITKYQKFISETIHRNQINFAYYNPRKMFDENRKKLKDKKNESRQNFKDNINNNAGICSEPFRNDFMLTIVFPSNNVKWEFMRLINRKEAEKFINYEESIDIFKEDYRL